MAFKLLFKYETIQTKMTPLISVLFIVVYVFFFAWFGVICHREIYCFHDYSSPIICSRLERI